MPKYNCPVCGNNLWLSKSTTIIIDPRFGCEKHPYHKSFQSQTGCTECDWTFDGDYTQILKESE